MTEKLNYLRAWYALAVLLLAMIISLVDRMVISLLVVPIQADLSLSDVQMGWILGVAFGLFYSIMGMPLGYLADRLHRSRLIAGGVFFWSVATLASGLASNFGELFVARMGVGIGEAVLAPAAWSLISDLFKEEHRGRAFGIFQLGAVSGTGIGLVAGGVLFGAISTADTAVIVQWLPALTPWRLVFILAAIPGILILPLILLIQDPRARQTHSERGAALIGDALSFLFREGRVLLMLFLAMGCIILMIYSVSAWMPATLSRKLGLDAATVGVAMGTAVLVGAIPAVIGGGWITDIAVSRGSRTIYVTLLTFSAAGMALPLLALIVIESHLGHQIAIAAFFFMACLPNGVLVAYIQRVTPPEIRGFVGAAYVLAVNVFGFVLGPTTIPFTAKLLPDTQGTIELAIIISGCVFGALALLVLLLAGQQSSALLARSR